jgi:capsular polysaccharide biosynthesis protein
LTPDLTVSREPAKLVPAVTSGGLAEALGSAKPEPVFVPLAPAETVHSSPLLFRARPAGSQPPKPKRVTELHPIGCWVATDVYVAAKGLVFAGDGRLLLSDTFGVTPWAIQHGLFGKTLVEPTADGCRLTSELPVRTVPGASILLVQPGDSVFGHWLIDLLPRLDIVRRLLGGTLAGAGLTPLFSAGSVFRRVIADVDHLLSLADLKREAVQVHANMKEILHLEAVVIPTYCRRGACLSPQSMDCFERLRQRALELFPGTASEDKVFLSRANWPQQPRPLSNREAVEQVFRDFGYRIVHPEQMELPDKVSLLRGASYLAGERGSALHMSIFCPEGARVGVLLSMLLDGMWFTQASLGSILGQPTGFLFGAADGAASGQFSIDTSQLADIVKRFLC